MIATMGLTIQALKKEPFSGSHHGMRYYLNSSGDTINAWIYPEPWCFEQTPEESRTYHAFPLTQDGLNDAIDWINASWEEDRAKWKQIDKDKMKILLRGTPTSSS
jgi:hypothetical protein